MNRIGGELCDELLEGITLECPACEKVTLVLDEAPPTLPADEGVFSTCRFCSGVVEVGVLFDRWVPAAWDMQGRPSGANVCPLCAQ
ncbi:hypothetical protein [Streptomyces erythrochromogenes]|uniref:hypothetical protein n=1 Tax=Streptomyces erythrochromogenes TaxID=285574 RepID=UPI0033EB0162